MVANKDKQEALVLLRKFSREEFAKVLEWSADLYHRVTTGFLNESYRTLRKAMGDIETGTAILQTSKTVGNHRSLPLEWQSRIRKGLYYFQGNDFSYDIIHSIKRTCEPCLEHTDNNFNPLEQSQKDSFGEIAQSIVSFLGKAGNRSKKMRSEILPPSTIKGNILINQLGVLKRGRNTSHAGTSLLHQSRNRLPHCHSRIPKCSSLHDKPVENESKISGRELIIT